MSNGENQDKGDYLGYEVYADTLWNRVEAALSKDQGDSNKLGDDPLVVGVFGEWGAGKSKLLSLILERAQRQRNECIAAHKRDDGFSLTVPVFFQPWKYEHEKHLLVPLLLHIEAELTHCLTLAESTSDRAKGKAVAVAEAVKAHVPAVVEGFKALWGAARTAYQLAEPTSAGVLLPLAEWLAAQLAKNGSSKEEGSPPMTKFRWEAEGGRSYYELHEVLKAVTRPTPEGIKRHLPNAKVDSSFCINFVIFIDDLDRCLPEKAVEALELIKTVFNLESFAFVLALDEEVVERGIGHRYKDYALQNKKPEMPITGFEYLEKIVHLPFRLPGLTPQRALQFLEQYENEHVLSAQLKGTYKPLAWMCKREFELHRTEPLTRGSGIKRGAGWRRAGMRQKTEHMPINLAQLVVDSFDAHVPRKLVRVVELFHQTLAVLTRRGRFEQVVPGGLIDPRLLMAFVLLQLFQPDLYRACRRSLTGFNVLLDAMKEPKKEMLESRPAAQSLGETTSDVDLWHWAVGWVGIKPPVSQSEALTRVPDLQPIERHEAQRIQLPLASRLVEHRATQRHVFDAMRLFKQLRPLLDEPGAQPINSAIYFGVLGPAEESFSSDDERLEVQRWTDLVGDAAQTGSSETVVVEPDGWTVSVAPFPALKATVLSYDLDELHAILTSGQDAERERLYKQSGLKVGERLSSEREDALLSRLEAEAKQISGTNVRELPLWRSRVLHGLTFLVPHFDRNNTGSRWWDLVKDVAREPSADFEFLNEEQVLLLARWMDVRGALRQDPRFDPDFLFLCGQRLFFGEGSEGKEPLPGFVRVLSLDEVYTEAKKAQGGLRPYFVARYLTTVDQFAAFVESDGYTNEAWWDSQGWAWVTGDWDNHKTTPAWLKQRLAQRSVKDRRAPEHWVQQRPWGSRPVGGVNWFEARAYARWLNNQATFRERLLEADLGQVQVDLPIESQWDRAARATGFNRSPDAREYVWGDEAAVVGLRANIRSRVLRGISPVGLFPASPLGLFDLNGNLREWQDNLFREKKRNLVGKRIPLLTSSVGTDANRSDWLKAVEEIEDSELVAARGGSWIDTGDLAKSSCRAGSYPHDSTLTVGFRVVLSVAG